MNQPDTVGVALVFQTSLIPETASRVRLEELLGTLLGETPGVP